MTKVELPQLSYAYNALEPFIDATTMEIHHSKHHQTYVNNLNTALEKYPEFSEVSLEELLKDPSVLPEDIRTSVINNGGGHYNHSLFWQFMAPQTRGPSQKLLQLLTTDFESLKNFQAEFSKAALGRFGSGWVWLVKDSASDMLQITSTANQDTPLSTGKTPILALDVWEHAYYLKYQNRRIEYVENWWNVVNWGEVEKRAFA